MTPPTPPRQETWENAVLSALEEACYLDQEQGGDGWVIATEVAAVLGEPSGQSVAQIMRRARDQGLVEYRPQYPPHRYPAMWSLSPVGVEWIRAGEKALVDGG